MSIDTTFKPIGPLTLIGATAVQVIPQGMSSGATLTFRIRNLLSTGAYFAYGPSSSIAAPTAPTAGVPQPNTIGMLPTSVETFELPPYSYFISNAAASFEVVAGQGS